MSKEYFTEVAEKLLSGLVIPGDVAIQNLAFNLSNMYSAGYNTARNNGKRRKPYFEERPSIIERAVEQSTSKLKGDELKSVLENVADKSLIEKSDEHDAIAGQRVMTDGSPVFSGHKDLKANGQQKGYVVLSQADRDKGFIRPVRMMYTHLHCGQKTSIDINIAETFARDPKFYSGTFCCNCGTHHSLNEFVWEGTDEEVGS